MGPNQCQGFVYKSKLLWSERLSSASSFHHFSSLSITLRLTFTIMANGWLNVFRLITLSIVTVCSIAVLGYSAYEISPDPHGPVDSLDGFGPFLYEFSLTAATFTVLAISITLFFEFFSKRLSVKTSNVIVELVRLTVLWAWWLSAGTIYYSFFHGSVPARDCKLYDFVDPRQPQRCYGLIVIPILCLINFALLFCLFVIILGFAVHNKHWKSAIHLTFLNKDGGGGEDSSNKSDKIRLNEV